MPHPSPLFHYVFIPLILLVLLFPAVSLPVVAAPAPPVLFQPGNGSTTSAQSYSYPPTGTPTFEWFPVEGAERYIIQICPSPDCASTIVNQETYATRYTAPDAPSDGIWYWRVRAYGDGAWGAWSTSWSFEKSWLDFGALAPQLLAPGAGATVEFFEYPIFSWSPVPGAAYYRFQFFTQPDCSGSAVYSRDVIKPTYAPTERRGRGDYYWRVVPIDHRNHQGTPSECRAFFMDYQQLPTLLSPADDVSLDFTPEFRWSAVKGAKNYRLQYGTDPDFQSGVTTVLTPNTRWTPKVTLPNNRDYYWRVAAVDSTNTAGPDSERRHFFMAWYLQPTLLSPTQNYIHADFPVFQWTPVAGTYRYRIQADDNYPGWPSPKFETIVLDPRYDHLNWGTIYGGEYYYWHVRSEDSAGNAASWSTDGGFQYSADPAPTLIYPPFYYDPAVIPSTQPLDVRTDPTVPVPVFIWDRVVNYDGLAADAYLIEVDDDPNFGSLDWYSMTANLSISPNSDQPFAPTPGIVYYWRVRAYRNGSPMSAFSEVWKARFDLQQALQPAISLYFPQDGKDNVWDAPLFGWSPVEGAARYHFQISDQPDFSSLANEAYPTYAFHTPAVRLTPDTYYWRVQAQDSGGNPIGSWSETWRLFINYPLRVGDVIYLPLSHPVLVDAYTCIGQDPSGDAHGGSIYDLTGLYIGLDDNPPPQNSFFYLTLDLDPITHSTEMYFVFYVDLDHVEGSGGASDPSVSPVFNIQADPLNLPELVLYARHTYSGEITDADMYRWHAVGSYWEGPIPLTSIGGGINYQRGQYLELAVPKTEIFLGEDWGGAISVQAFSAPASGGQAYDTVPSELGSPTSNLTNFVSAADKLNLLYPWDNPFTNPVIFNQNPALSFSKPLFRSRIRGYRIEVAREPGFTPPLITSAAWESTSPPVYFFVGTRWTWTDSFEQENSIYWRVRIWHANSYGPWSQSFRFTKVLYKPVQATAEYTYTTPTFSWDRVEGAASTRIEVNRDPNFAGSGFADATPNTSYTRDGALGDGTWYWRLRSYDASNNASDYTEVRSFVKLTLAPTLTSPIGGAVINELPTLLWQDVLYPAVNPVMSSPRYRLILHNDPEFSPPYVWQADTDSTSITPDANVTKMEDGYYYWKVAVLDASGNVGEYSAVGMFYKGYLPVTLVSQEFHPSPDLTWLPVDGAASYQVQICLDADYSQGCQTLNTGQTNYVGVGKYQAIPYYWRVRMCDLRGACGPYTQGVIGPRGLVYLPMVAKDYRP